MSSPTVGKKRLAALRRALKEAIDESKKVAEGGDHPAMRQHLMQEVLPVARDLLNAEAALAERDAEALRKGERGPLYLVKLANVEGMAGNPRMVADMELISSMPGWLRNSYNEYIGNIPSRRKARS